MPFALSNLKVPAQWGLFCRQRLCLLTYTLWWNTCPIYEHLRNLGCECAGGCMAAMNLPSQDRWLQRDWRLRCSQFLFYVVCKFFVLRHWLPPRAFGELCKGFHNTDVVRGAIWSALVLLPKWVTWCTAQIDNMVHNLYFVNGRTTAHIGKIAQGSTKHWSLSGDQRLGALWSMTFPPRLSKTIYHMQLADKKRCLE